MSANKLRLFALLAAGSIVTAVTPLASLARSPVQSWTPVDRYGDPVIYGNDEVPPTPAPCFECVWFPTYNEIINGQKVLIPGHWERIPGHRPPPPRPAKHLHDD